MPRLPKISRHDPVNPSSEYVALGRRLAEARENANMYQTDVTAILGIHPSVLSQIENGRRRLSVFELEALAGVYKVSSRWLLFGNDYQDAVGNPVELPSYMSTLIEELRALPEETAQHLTKLFRGMIAAERHDSA